MKNTIAYFRHQIKSNLRPFLFITLFALLFTFVIGLTAQPIYRYSNVDGTRYIAGYYSTLYLPVIVLCILCYLIPFLQFSDFKKRRNLDCYYALPISRRSLGLVHYAVGLILVLLPFSICYLQNFILLLTRGTEYFDFSPIIGHYFLCLLLGWIMYSFFTFVFNEGNSKIDGCFFIFLWTFVFTIIALAVNTFDAISNRVLSYGYLGIPWMVINDITTVFQKVVEKDRGNLADLWTDSGFVFWFVLWIIVGVLATVGFFSFFGKKKTEKAGETSDSWFGYRILIPLFSICVLVITELEIGFYIIVMITSFAGYSIYRRGFKYKISDLIVMGILALFLLGKVF